MAKKKGVTLLMSLRKKCFCTPAQKSRAIELSELVRKTVKKIIPCGLTTSRE